MDGGKLSDLIEKELSKNPEAYRKVIVPALAKSKLSSLEVVRGYAEYVGLPLSKVQISWMIQHDEDRKKMVAEKDKRKQENDEKEKAMRRRVEAWGSVDKHIYSIGDFPIWLVENLEKPESSAENTVNTAVNEIMNANPNTFPDCLQDIPEQYAIVNGEALFTEYGYKYLIMTAFSRGWASSFECKQWRTESGLF